MLLLTNIFIINILNIFHFIDISLYFFHSSFEYKIEVIAFDPKATSKISTEKPKYFKSLKKFSETAHPGI